jgi:hypothetical protein
LALLTNGIDDRLHAEHPLGLSELVRNLSEMYVRHCIHKHQIGYVSGIFHMQNDRLIQESIKSMRLSGQIIDDRRTDYNRRSLEK